MKQYNIKRKNIESPLVFYCQLRDFSQKSHNIMDWLSNEQEQAGRNHVVRSDYQGKTLFVFDGLDELNEIDRAKFTAWLNRFISDRPSLATIVTSRELDSLNAGVWKSFRKARLLPFDRVQVDEYCRLVLENHEKAREFTEVLDSNPELGDFLRNPFSLSLALGMYLLRGSLPFNLGVLCKEIVAQLVERWDARRGIRRGARISVESINSTLGRLAYRLQENQMVQFGPEYLKDLLPYEVESLGSDAVLHELSERTGLIRELSRERWAFSHRYLQDFFCANYLVERASGLGDELELHGRDADWVNVWRQVGQLCRDPEFFALSRSRGSSDSIKSVDRLISALLSHDGISKSELEKIVEGISVEMNLRESNLPSFALAKYGVDLDCRRLDNQSILILAKTVMHLSYLRKSDAGRLLLSSLESSVTSNFGEMAKLILRSQSKSVPIIGPTSLQVHIEDAH